MSSPTQWGNSTAHIIVLSGLVHILTVFIFPGEGSGTLLTMLRVFGGSCILYVISVKSWHRGGLLVSGSQTASQCCWLWPSCTPLFYPSDLYNHQELTLLHFLDTGPFLKRAGKWAWLRSWKLRSEVDPRARGALKRLWSVKWRDIKGIALWLPCWSGG